MNRICYISGLLLLAMIAAGCGPESSGNDFCNTDIPFLMEGKVWHYQTTGSTNGSASLTVGACNGDGYVVTGTMNGTDYTDLYREKNGYLEVDSDYDSDYFSKNYKLNAQLGDSWTHVMSDGTIVTHEVISVDSIITVPAGTFTTKVFKYYTTSALNSSYTFWDDEIGEIKENRGSLIIELESYE